MRSSIVVLPMCQYHSIGGHPTDWHPTHYECRARGGAGLVVVEATAVSPEDRITPGCLGLWSDSHASSCHPEHRAQTRRPLGRIFKGFPGRGSSNEFNHAVTFPRPLALREVCTHFFCHQFSQAWFFSWLRFRAYR